MKAIRMVIKNSTVDTVIIISEILIKETDLYCSVYSIFLSAYYYKMPKYQALLYLTL